MAAERAKCPLRVLIVGAGIGGLAAAVTLGRRGHHVVLVEAAPKLMEVGAGIQVAPNMLRLLDRWGAGESVRATGVKAREVQILRWQNGKILAKVPVDQSYGDQLVAHRANLHTALLHKAQSMSNVDIRIDSLVQNVNFEPPSVELADGKILDADVVLAGDGIKSIIRTRMNPDSKDHATPVGDACFRVVLDRKLLENDSELAPYINESIARRWIGPDHHVVGYPVSNYNLYNIVTAHPDKRDVEESWTMKSSKTALLKEFEGWDPHLVKMMSLVPDGEVLEWKLCTHPPLKTWIRGRVALLGDACHPMLPYVAQGAAQAIEDAAALGIILSNVTSVSQVSQALQIYEQCRKERAEVIQAFGHGQRESLHLHDGPEQIARDLQFANPSTGEKKKNDRWVDDETRKYMWLYDVEQEAQKAWDQGSGNQPGPRL